MAGGFFFPPFPLLRHCIPRKSLDHRTEEEEEEELEVLEPTSELPNPERPNLRRVFSSSSFFADEPENTIFLESSSWRQKILIFSSFFVTYLFSRIKTDGLSFLQPPLFLFFLSFFPCVGDWRENKRTFWLLQLPPLYVQETTPRQKSRPGVKIRGLPHLTRIPRRF